MPITSANNSAVDRQGDWMNVGANQEVTNSHRGTSFLDPLKESLIGNTNLTHNQALDAPNNKATDVRSTIEALGSLNADNLGSDSFSLLRLLHQCSLEQRTGARMVRQSEALASKNAKFSAAQEIRESAFQKMIGGITAGALQIGSAGIQAYSATQTLKSISSLKEPTPTNVPDANDTANAVSANNGIRQDIAVKAEPGSALIEQPLSKPAGTDTANAIAADQNKALVTHNSQAGGQDPQITFKGQGDTNKMVVAGSESPQRTVSIDDQGTLTVRDAKGNQTLMIEVVDDAAEIAPAPTPAPAPAEVKTPTSSDAAEAKVDTPSDRELALKELDFKAARLKAASEITQALGGVFNSFAQNSAASHDAQKAEHEATATTHDMASHQASDEIQQTLEQARGWREMLQGIDQNNSDTNRGISRNI